MKLVKGLALTIILLALFDNGVLEAFSKPGPRHIIVSAPTAEQLLENWRLIERAQRTFRGSRDDIGWLQCDPEMPPEDETERFVEILHNIRDGQQHILPNSMVYLSVPEKRNQRGQQ